MAGSRDAGTSGAGAVPLRSTQMMGQQQQHQQQQICTYQQQCKTNLYLPTAVSDRSVLTNSTARQICTYQQRCKTDLYLLSALQDKSVHTNSTVLQMSILTHSIARQICTYQQRCKSLTGKPPESTPCCQTDTSCTYIII